jgi:prolyl 4-hydroxylase
VCFAKAGLKVVPKKRDFLLFSHRNSETGDMSELTEHSGCPVREGDKWVATQWYREGVSEDARWNSFENWGM